MRILIVGVSTRAIADSALAAGYDFLTLDYFGDYDQKSLCANYSLKRDFGRDYAPAALYEAARRLQYDAVAYTASLENYPWLVRKLAGVASQPLANWQEAGWQVLLGNSAEVLAQVRHGPAFFRFLARQGMPVPRTLPAGQPAGAADRAPGRRWLRKPVRSGGGHDIAFWPEERAPGRSFMLQEYLPGRPCSAAFLANGRDAVLLGLTEQLIGRPEFGARDFAYCGNLYPLPHAARDAGAVLWGEVSALAAALAREFSLVGLNGLDFILADGRCWPVEINPRYTAAMELIELATGLSLFDLHVRSIQNGELPAAGMFAVAGDPAAYHGKAIVYAERNCRAPDTTGWMGRGIRDVPFPGEEIAAGEPVCTVFASAVSGAACYAGLVEKAQAVKGELYA